jgi:hypothetical protein
MFSARDSRITMGRQQASSFATQQQQPQSSKTGRTVTCFLNISSFGKVIEDYWPDEFASVTKPLRQQPHSMDGSFDACIRRRVGGGDSRLES